MLVDAAEKYNGKFLILEKDHPDGLDDLYTAPEKHPDSLQYLTTVEGTHIFILE